MAIPQEIPFLSPDDYLAMERTAEFKSEYVDGEVFAMSGGSMPHSVIAVNLTRHVSDQLEGKPCLALNSDMKVWIGEANQFAYPDLSALCGDPEFYDDQQDVITNPSFIAEVLSPSTELYDRGGKFRKYQRLPSLREYLLLSQTERLAELFLRQEDDTWNLRVLDNDQDCLQIPSLGVEIPLAKLYDKVDFEAD